MLSAYDSAGAYVATEKNVTLTSRTYRAGTDKRLVIYSPGRAQTALEALSATYGGTAKALAEAGYAVLSIDAGTGVDWGNATNQGRYDSAIAWARSGPLGASAIKPPLLVGTSHGGLGSLKYARTHAVAGVVSIIGALDPDWVHDTNAHGFAAEMESAYGGLAGWDAAVPTTSPLAFASELTMPVLAVKSTTDTVTPNASADAFAAAAGADVLSLGAVGHAITGLDPATIVTWALENCAP